MASRRKPESSGRFWPKAIFLIVLCTAAGFGLGYYYLAGRVLPPWPHAKGRAADSVAQAGQPAAAPAPAANPAEESSKDPELGKLNRAQLEREVHRLNEELDDKNRQIDELTIQLKLAQSSEQQ